MSDLQELKKTYPELAEILLEIYRDRGPLNPADIKKKIKVDYRARINKIYNQLLSLREVEDIRVEMLGHDEENDLSHYISIKVPEKNNKKFEIEIFISDLAPYAAISVFVDKREAHPDKKDVCVYRQINVEQELKKDQTLQNLFGSVRDIMRKNKVQTVPWWILNLKVPNAQLVIQSEKRNDVFDLLFGEPALFW